MKKMLAYCPFLGYLVIRHWPNAVTQANLFLFRYVWTMIWEVSIVTYVLVIC